MNFLSLLSHEQWADLGAIGSCVSALVSIILIGIAIYSLGQWRSQLVGTSKHEIARNLVRLAFQFREEFRQAKRVAYTPDEALGRTNINIYEPANPELTYLDALSFVVKKRLLVLSETLYKLKATSWEAETLLEKEVQGYTKPFNELYEKLADALSMYINWRYSNQKSHLFANTPKPRDDFYEAERKIFGDELGDELLNSIDHALNDLRQNLKRYIK